MNIPKKTYPTIACCGLDCGLCPRYYTVGTSRCPGCAGPNFSSKHPSCSFITCCVIKKKLEVCAQCSEFPCPKFKTERQYQQMKESSSYPPNRKILPNLNFIKKYGLKKFIQQQNKRIKILQTMLNNFNDGRSRSFFCRATAMLDLKNLEKSLNRAVKKIKTDKVRKTGTKSKTRILREILNETASKQGIELVKKK